MYPDLPRDRDNGGGEPGFDEIIAAQDFSLAEAARPAFGATGVWFTVAIAVVATASGVTASIFAASRMLAKLSMMKQVPHRHVGLPGTVRTHTTVYTVALAMALTACSTCAKSPP